MDAEHDRLVRALFYLVNGLELLAPEARARAIAEVRERMLPDGLSMTMRSYAEEAAEATKAPARLRPEDLELLGTLSVPGGRTLLSYHEEWVATCAEFGRIEAERAAVSRAEAAASNRAIGVRNLFGRTVAVFQGLAALSSSADHPLLQTIREMEACADARARERRAARRAQDAAGRGGG